MRVFVSGNPLTRSHSTNPVFTQPGHIPPAESWDLPVDVTPNDAPAFFEHLYTLSQEENGFAYFYPEAPDGSKVIRIELHRKWRGDPVAIRKGFLFNYRPGEAVQSATAYIAPNSLYEKREVPETPWVLPSSTYRKIKEECRQFVEGAKTRIASKRTKVFHIAHFIVLPSNYVVDEAVWRPARGFELARTMVVDGRAFSAIVTREVAHSELHAERLAREKAYFVAGLLSIALGQNCAIASIPNHHLSLRKLDDSKPIADGRKLYPKIAEEVNWSSRSVSKKMDLFDWVYGVYLRLDPDNAASFRRALLSFLTGCATSATSRTIGLVGFVACLATLSEDYREKCKGKVVCSCCGPRQPHDLIGDRAAIEVFVNSFAERRLGPNHEQKQFISDWVRRTYGRLRSSFVHSGEQRFDEFWQQSSAAERTVGLPNALPVSGRFSRPIYYDLRDYEVALELCPPLLCFWLAVKSGEPLLAQVLWPAGATPSAYPRMEAYVGLPTSGWHCLAPGHVTS